MPIEPHHAVTMSLKQIMPPPIQRRPTLPMSFAQAAKLESQKNKELFGTSKQSPNMDTQITTTHRQRMEWFDAIKDKMAEQGTMTSNEIFDIWNYRNTGRRLSTLRAMGLLRHITHMLPHRWSFADYEGCQPPTPAAAKQPHNRITLKSAPWEKN